MKAAIFNECGGPEKIHIADVPTPPAYSGEAVVAVKACALNYMDLWALWGPADENTAFPFWGGADVAGVVAKTGPGVEDFTPGERVVVNPSLYCGKCEFCIAGEESLCIQYGILGGERPGGLAEYVSVPASSLLRLPEPISFEEAAAVPLVFQTAWRALISQARLSPGEDVLILGGSGGVASAAIQIARLAGARVFTVTSSEEKMRKAKELGAEIVFNRNEGDFWEELARVTAGRGVDVVVDGIGADTWAKSLSSLVKGGRLVTYGRTTGRMGETNISLVFWNQLHIIGSTMANREEFATVMRLVFARKLRPVIDRVFPFEETRQAYEWISQGKQFGKVVIRVSL